LKVGIVGGGIGGLAAAIALRRKGVEAIVFEQAEEPRALGAGLHLWSNAVQALREIGLGDAIDAVSVPIEYERMHTAAGKRLVEWPVGDLSRKLGVPSIGLSRPALLSALLAAVDGNALKTGRSVAAFEQTRNSVSLRLTDGSSEFCDVMIGADGLESTTRAQLRGAKEPRYLGYTTWRTLLPPEAHDLPARVLNQYWGRGVRFICFPAAPDGTVYLVCLAKAPPGGIDRAGQAKQRVVDHASEFAEPVPSLAEACEDSRLIRADIADRRPIKRWGEGRVTLLGDAAHPMAPNVSQGAGMALEDAAVLARILGGGSATPESLRAYEKRRWKRAALMVALSRFPGTLGLVRHPLACRARNAYIRVAFGGPSWAANKRLVARGY